MAKWLPTTGIPDKDMDQQKPGSGSSSSLHHNRHYDLDKNDHQIALALSEFPQMDKEVARRLTKFEPVKVLSTQGAIHDAFQ